MPLEFLHDTHLIAQPEDPWLFVLMRHEKGGCGDESLVERSQMKHRDTEHSTALVSCHASYLNRLCFGDTLLHNQADICCNGSSTGTHVMLVDRVDSAAPFHMAMKFSC